MIDWTEISPKGTREKVYLVLKEHQKPLHFIEIAKTIDKFKLGKRKAHPQTVHNELIKDERFILIGRGIYALSEWGYFQGTIKEVIESILEKNKKPMDKNQIIEEVLKIRKVKKTTIMINLNNKNYFKREGEFYLIKK
jgi:DNA-directed RNA polymerase delta subunit